MPSIEQLEREVKALRALAMFFARQIPEAAKAAKGEIRRIRKEIYEPQKEAPQLQPDQEGPASGVPPAAGDGQVDGPV